MAAILVVDDDAFSRVFLNTVLGIQLRHTVEFAPDGVVGIWSYERTRPDLVITDVTLPYLDGVPMIEHLTAVHPDSKIIAASAKAWDTLSEAEGAGALASLKKPFRRDELVAAVDWALSVAEPWLDWEERASPYALVG